jgi:hypothetical protein
MVADRAGSGPTPARSIRYLQIVLLIAVIGVLNFGGAWFAEQIDLQIFPRHDSMLHMAILAIAAYFLLMVIPFLPGIGRPGVDDDAGQQRRASRLPVHSRW